MLLSAGGSRHFKPVKGGKVKNLRCVRSSRCAFHCLSFCPLIRYHEKTIARPGTHYRQLRAKAGSHLLVAAIHHLQVFDILAATPCNFYHLRKKTGLKPRPAMVLFPALAAMGLIAADGQGLFRLTELGRYLSVTEAGNVTGYTGLEKSDQGVLQMTACLKNDGPLDIQSGLSYVKDDTAPSPMDEPEAARFFTLALAGRARYLSPLVAASLPSHNGHLLDVAGGTGFYTYEWLLANPNASATLFDRPEVLKVAEELLIDFCGDNRQMYASIHSRLHFIAGDMLVDSLPPADLLLAASLFHDWPEDVCCSLAKKFAGALNPGGEIWIHDAFLADSFDGPLAVTDYSALLFLATKGRAYSRGENRNWLAAAGLQNKSLEIATLMDYGLIAAIKPAESRVLAL